MIGREEEVEDGARPSAPHQDICTRTSWVDARTALSHIYKGRATGSRGALWVRKGLQDQLYQLGKFSDRHAGKILFVALLIMATLSVGLRSVVIETDIEKLWVEEGGRLEKELDYVSKTLGDGTGTTNQILIQTPKKSGSENILTVDAMNAHLNVLLPATKVTIDIFDTSWSLTDLCYATSFPYFEHHLIDQIFEKLAPCAIITPLDCFWEGSKLLGPDFFVTIPGYGEKVKWTNLNPQRIVDKMKIYKDSNQFFPFSTFNAFMKRAGITTGYQQKPCLNPSDPACPRTAPNKKSLKAPDIGAELTSGCYGFAGKYLHWPEELIVGGTKKNRTRHIVRGEALQSIVQLMGPKDLYEHFQYSFKVKYIGWTQEKARIVLDAWVDRFSHRVRTAAEERANETDSFNLQPYSSTSLTSLMKRFSNVSVPRILIGAIVMVAYVSLSLFRLNQSSESGAGLGFAGVLLVTASVASGLGLCALLGLPYNAATTQILPFLALGLGVDDIFLIVLTIAEVKLTDSSPNGYKVSHAGEVIKRCGVSVLLTSVCVSAAFFAAAIVPIPALRILCLQAGLLVLSTLAGIILVFPSLVSLDIRRRKAEKSDILCCLPMFGTKEPQDTRAKSTSASINDNSKRTAVTRALSPPGRGTVTQVLCSPPSAMQESWVGLGSLQIPSPSLESLTAESTRDLVREREQSWWLSLLSCGGWSITRFVKDIYAPAITSGCVKVFVMISLFITILISVWGMSKLKDGLDLADIVPSGTAEAQFLEAQQKYFGFYYMFAVTQGNFEYPTKQKLLHEYHETFNRVPWIIKNDDGGLPDSWLSLFREWLLGLQRAFDEDWKKGLINEEGWNQHNTSDSAILAFKLLAQTGHVDHPVDRSLVIQGRLVDDEGIINPKAFYNYLTAWVSNDALAYSASQSDLRPIPRIWYHEGSDHDLKIPKSSPLVYAQFPFYLNQMEDTETITQMIKEVRTICTRFEELGLPNFPTGIPFTYWEQYINLRFFLLLALAVILITVFLVLSTILVNIWAAALVVLVIGCLVLQLTGFLGIMGLKLSAAPAVLLVVSVGIGIEFTIHITLGFLTAIGDRNQRVRVALTHMAAPIIHGATSTFLATTMLVFSEFDFIRKYFFYVLTALVVLGAIDGLLFLPVLLSLVGPPAELVSLTHLDRVPVPSPPVTPPPPYSSRLSSNRRPKSSSSSSSSHHQSSSSKRHHYPSHHGSNLSLTTITEEPASNGSSSSSSNSSSPSSPCSSRHSSSHEILVEPQVVVETTTYNGKPVAGGRDGDSVVYEGGHHVTTTVTATAKVKVELYKAGTCVGDSSHHHRSNSSNSSHGSSRRSSPTNVSLSSSRSSRSSSKRSSRTDSDSEGLRSSH